MRSKLRWPLYFMTEWSIIGSLNISYNTICSTDNLKSSSSRFFKIFLPFITQLKTFCSQNTRNRWASDKVEIGRTCGVSLIFDFLYQLSEIGNNQWVRVVDRGGQHRGPRQEDQHRPVTHPRALLTHRPRPLLLYLVLVRWHLYPQVGHEDTKKSVI